MTMAIGGSTGLVFPDNSTQNTAPKYGMVNRIINGAMLISQRGTSFSSSSVTNGDYQLDRWSTWCNNGSANATVAQSSTAPTGFVNSLLFTNVTAVTVGSADRAQLIQPIEGLNCTDLAWGTASASPVTLSFWVRCSLTGTFGGSLQNSATNRSYPFSYTISAANTWEQKTITVAGDTTGTWLTTNGIGIQLNFDLGCGSTLKGTAGAWAAANYRGATGAVNLTANAGATFYITGVQLEKGSTATSFDYRPYGTELALCQRYCYKVATSGSYSTYATTGQFVSTTRVDFPILFPTYMRASPTGTYTSANTYLPSSAGSDFTPSAVASVAGSASPQGIAVTFTVSGATAGRASTLTDNNTAASSMIFSAEL